MIVMPQADVAGCSLALGEIDCWRDSVPRSPAENMAVDEVFLTDRNSLFQGVLISASVLAGLRG
jgi:hypothetical protein